jgi:hypothetical protein
MRNRHSSMPYGLPGGKMRFHEKIGMGGLKIKPAQDECQMVGDATPIARIQGTPIALPYYQTASWLALLLE